MAKRKKKKVVVRKEVEDQVPERYPEEEGAHHDGGPVKLLQSLLVGLLFFGLAAGSLYVFVFRR